MLFGKHINRYYIKYAYLLLIGIAALILVDYLQLIIPELYRNVINGLNQGYITLDDGTTVAFDIDYLLDKICLPMIGIIIGIVTGRFLWRVCFFGSGNKVVADLRYRMFDHCKDLSQQYYQKNKVGNLMSLFTNDLETIRDCYSNGVLMTCDAAFLGILSFIKMLRMNALMSLLCMIPIILLFGVGLTLMQYMEKKWEVRQEAFSKLSDFSQESFSGIAVIKAFVKESKELMAFRKLNKENEDANVEYTRLSTLMTIFVTLLVESVICVILGYGSYLVYKGTFNAGQLVEFMGYFNSIVWPVMAVAELINMHSQGTASLKRISELLDAEVDVKDREDVTDIENVRGDIEFRDLTFRYPDGEYDVLKNASFKINAGESVGVIGRTGAGKTTLADLILRIYNVPDGKIFVDGKDVNSISIASLRKYCAYVPQDNFLFSDTIENNIEFATDDVSHEKAVEAAKLSAVDDNIAEFAQGYETVLGERGVTVSGGQKQRISIARALMKNASILILDDSVSAVDIETEKEILSGLKTSRKGKTTILIAHRVTTIEHMDKIIFIDDGNILAVGNHEELYSSCPQYKLTVDLQRLESERGASNA
ncbi:MAG: ABC transporter ATP-binding protein/permease [Oscillospiraceae bacterium]|nr:ABC transporter ATP-binding protein/permease [Oscillospiraceae bacterium]